MKNVLFMVESGPALGAVKRHIEERQRVQRECVALCKELGVDLANRDPLTGVLRGVVFPRGRVHEDFKAPDRKHGVSYPKKGGAWAERFAAQKGHDNPAAVISTLFNVPLSINYKSATGEGWRCIGSMLTECGWLYFGPEGPYAMWVPDVPGEVAAEFARGNTVADPAASFRMEFPGCRRIEDEEWDILVAQHKLAQKRAARQESA